MTGVKLFLLSMSATGMPIVGLLSEVSGDARTLEQATPTFVLAVITIVFAATIVALYKQLLDVSARHHAEWKDREEMLKDERERRHTEMTAVINRNTEAFAGVKAVVENCRSNRG